MKQANKAHSGGRFGKLFGYLRLLGIAMFVVLLFRIDFTGALHLLPSVSKALLMAGLFFQLLVLAAKGIRWHLMNGNSNSAVVWKQSLGRFYESYAIGIVTPGRMGELLKAGHETESSHMLAALIRVLAERGLDIGVFVLLAGLSVLAGDYLTWPTFWSWLIIFAGFAAILISMMLLASGRFINLINQLLSHLPGKVGKIKLARNDMNSSRASFIIVLSLISNLSYFVSCYFLALATGLEAGFVWTSGAVAVSGLLNMLPVTIMGVGTRELTFLFVFSAFPQALVLSFSLLVMLVAQIGGGLIALVAGQLFLISTHRKNE